MSYHTPAQMDYAAGALFPTAPMPETHTVNVERAKSQARIELDAPTKTVGNERELWLLYMQVFEARMDMLKLLISKGMQPLGPERISIKIEINQKAIPDTVPGNFRDKDYGGSSVRYLTYEQPTTLGLPR